MRLLHRNRDIQLFMDMVDHLDPKRKILTQIEHIPFEELKKVAWRLVQNHRINEKEIMLFINGSR